MSDGTKIEWADATWNPMSGCSPVSVGCANCYAERMARRNLHPANDGRPPFAVRLHPERLGIPYRWRKPRRIFVCSTGDLFHEDVPFEFIRRVFVVAQENKRHTFLFLTKRPERMREFIAEHAPVPAMTGARWGEDYTPTNIWLGVTAENQEQADERIPVLLSIPAARRFVSIEPMLGPVDLNTVNPTDDFWTDALDPPDPSFRLSWVIVGGETGPGARPMHPDWPRLVRDQCVAAGVPFLFKQWGEWAQTTPVAGGDLGEDVRRGYTRIMRRDREPDGHFRHGDVWVYRVGKKTAGRLLDGREWNEYPK
jgi:protein gp37